MNPADRLNEIRATIPANVKIVAVSKTKPATVIESLYKETAQRIFGENKVQELQMKHEILPSDINWHFIGHLQTNKIRYIAPYVDLIQSVDSYKLIREINKEGKKNNRIIQCLIQYHIAEEESKFGFSLNESFLMLDDNLFHELSNISITGVMGMATFTSDKEQVQREFGFLSDCFKTLKSSYFSNSPHFKEISMGMSGDFEAAIRAGSTMVRIGSLIFGERIKRNNDI